MNSCGGPRISPSSPFASLTRIAGCRVPHTHTAATCCFDLPSPYGACYFCAAGDDLCAGGTQRAEGRVGVSGALLSTTPDRRGNFSCNMLMLISFFYF